MLNSPIGHAERFDHVIVGAQLEPHDAVGESAARGDHDDRDARALPEPAAHVASVLIGQGQIEQDHVGRERRGELDRLATRPRHPGPEADPRQRPRERLGDRLFVLDQEHENPGWG